MTLPSEEEGRELPRGSLRVHIQAAFGLDRATVYGLIGAMRTVLIGPVVALLIATFFSPDLQGYYYAFASIVGFQMLAEFGMGQAVMHFASHEWSRVGLGPGGTIEGDPVARRRLAGLARISGMWFGAAAVAVALGIGALGLLFFASVPGSGVAWRAPWAALVGVVALRFLVLPVLAVLQGCQHVREANLIRLVDGVSSSLVLALGIVAGLRLWALPLGMAVGATAAAALILLRTPFVLTLFISREGKGGLSWRSELLPFQWRIALTWAAGYASSQLIVPLLFYYRGPAEAGRLGLTWAVLNSILLVSGVWVQTRAPQFGVLVARRDWPVLDSLYVRATALGVGSAAVAGAAFVSGVLVLASLGHPLASRVLDPFPAVLLTLGVVLAQVNAGQLAYLRAHRREPFLPLYLGGGAVLGLTLWVAAARYGMLGVAAGYLLVIGTVFVPVGTWIWWRCRTEWHIEPPTPSANSPAAPAIALLGGTSAQRGGGHDGPA